MNRSINIIRESRLGATGLMLESMSMRELCEAVESDPSAKKSLMRTLWEKFRDSSLVDLALAIIGLGAGTIGSFLAPESLGLSAVISMVPDLVDAVRRFARGDKWGAGLSLICAIPFAGDAAAAVIESERALSTGVKSTLTIIKSLGRWCKTHRDQVRTIRTGTSEIAKVLVEHLPDMREHHDAIIQVVNDITSGDEKKMKDLAKESGVKVDETKPEDLPSGKPPPPALAEGHPRRSYRLVDLYEGTLYERKTSRSRR